LLGGGFVDATGFFDHAARFNADGTADSRFRPSVNGPVEALAVETDGNVVVGGWFQNLGGQQRNCIGRLILVAPAFATLTTDGAIVTWLRGGTSPEVSRTSFEVSTNGTNWTVLGTGTRIPGGWQLSGGAIPQPSVIRARGFLSGGLYNGSSWFVEITLNVDPAAPPRILTGDDNFGFRTNRFGFTIAGLLGQTVVVEGSTNLSNWIALATNSIVNGGFYFDDPATLNFSRRFYRARLQ
jgi:hypothetical protein